MTVLQGPFRSRWASVVNRRVFFGSEMADSESTWVSNWKRAVLSIFRTGFATVENRAEGETIKWRRVHIQKKSETAILDRSRWLHQIAVQGAIYPFWYNPVDVLEG